MVKAAEKNFYGQFVPSTNEDQGNTGTPDDNKPTPEEIVNAAWALAPGETYGDCSLTGVVTEITGAYNAEYKNVTFNIVVAGLTDKPIIVFRAKGDCADKIAVGDTVTVTGTLLNYVGKDAAAEDPGKVEFNSGCTLSDWVDADAAGGDAPGGDAPSEVLTNKFNANILSVETTATGTDASSYKDRTSTEGWTSTGSRVDAAAKLTGNDNPVLTLNGKTSAPGTLKSGTLNNGISKLFFNYGFAFTDTQVSLTVNVKQGDQVVATTTLDQADLTKETVYSFTWTLDTAVAGDFTLEVINNCKSAQNSNKDRVAIWNLSWENA
jgi:hypothetical protein